MAGRNQSGPRWQLTSVFAGRRDIPFDNKQTIEYVFEVKYKGHEVGACC